MRGRIPVISVLIALLLIPLQAQALEVSATAAILMDGETGQVYYEKNADRRMLIASTTKIMTALVALDTAQPDEIVTVKQSHMVEGSSMYLKPGEELTVETLLYGLLLSSGNDAALALADHCGGGVDNFVALMNEKAHELGLAGTSFANPNGLDAPTHYSTARDMAVLAACAAQNETFVRISSTSSVTVGGRYMTNHNKLLSYVEGCIGMKTGYTRAAGRTLVSCVRRDGRCLVAVTLQDGNDWMDHQAMYEFGFSCLQEKPAEEISTAAVLLPDVTERLQSYLALRERGEVS